MSNAYFQFKQFRVQQDSCAMKVSTDACIHGAWTPIAAGVKRVLDIGAGTGLLSLMLAQRKPDAVIDAIELNESAAAQAADNASASPFADRIRIIQADAAEWETTEACDLVICNPPFFSNALLGPDTGRNAARHVATLDAKTLVRLSLNLLSRDGAASFLWPAEAHDTFCAIAEAEGLYLSQQLNIQHRPGSAVSRVIGLFGRQKPDTVNVETLTIKDAQDQYTTAFIELLKPFYLYL